MDFTRKVVFTAICAILLTAETRLIAAESSPLPQFPAPAVYEFRIERTSAPLSLVNAIPPPLPFEEVQRQKENRATSESLAIQKTVDSQRKYVPSIPTKNGIRRISRPQLNDTGSFRLTRPTPRPMVTSQSYPDRVRLTNDQVLRCRILTDTANTMSMEIENGAAIVLPKRRIRNVERNVDQNE